jgi:hypothetical protein
MWHIWCIFRYWILALVFPNSWVRHCMWTHMYVLSLFTSLNSSTSLSFHGGSSFSEWLFICCLWYLLSEMLLAIASTQATRWWFHSHWLLLGVYIRTVFFLLYAFSSRLITFLLIPIYFSLSLFHASRRVTVCVDLLFSLYFIFLFN